MNVPSGADLLPEMEALFTAGAPGTRRGSPYVAGNALALRAGEYRTGRLMTWTRVFRGVRDQAPWARRFVAFLLEDCAFRDDACTIVAELVANALAHSRSGAPGGVFVVDVARWPGGARIAVTDQGGPHDPAPYRLVAAYGGAAGSPGPHPGPPRPGTPAGEPATPPPDDVAQLVEGGRGLATVAALAARWGWHGNPTGRTVFAELAAAAAPRGTAAPPGTPPATAATRRP